MLQSGDPLAIRQSERSERIYLLSRQVVRIIRCARPATNVCPASLKEKGERGEAITPTRVDRFVTCCIE